MQRAHPVAERVEATLLADTRECSELMDTLLAEAARVDQATAHTPAYQNENYQVARDLYTWTCGQANVYPQEWTNIHRTLTSPPSADLILLQALAIRTGARVPAAPLVYDRGQYATMAAEADGFVQRATLTVPAATPAPSAPGAERFMDLDKLHSKQGAVAGDLTYNGAGTSHAGKAPKKQKSKLKKGAAAPSGVRTFSAMESAPTFNSAGGLVYAPASTEFEPAGELPSDMVHRYPWLKKINQIFAARRTKKSSAKQRKDDERRQHANAQRLADDSPYLHPSLVTSTQSRKGKKRRVDKG